MYKHLQTRIGLINIYGREDLKSDTASNLFINEVNSLNIKLGLCLVHTFTFVTSLLKKACIFCTAKLSNQPNNIRDEHGNFVVSFLQHHRRIHYMNYQRRSYVSLSIGVASNSLLSFTSVNLIDFEFTFI